MSHQERLTSVQVFASWVRLFSVLYHCINANCDAARALYSYSAAIPEELSFSKGDILAVLRLQDDGWWEAEVNRSLKTGGSGQGGIGLVPSNYLQRC